jgi:DNA end-binding protein Ku
MARAIWKGYLTLGAVSVPVKLTTAVRQKDIAFHQLSPDGSCRLRTKLVCPETGREYDLSKTAKGYEIAPGQFVLVNKDELQKLKVEATKTIRIDRFVKAGEMDPIYYDHSYYLAPDTDARAYRLLVEAMGIGRVGLGTMVMRGRKYAVGVRVNDESLLLHTLHYPDEIISARDAGVDVGHVKATKAEAEMAEHLIQMLARSFAPNEHRDTYRRRVQELIRRKAAGEKVAVAASDEIPPTYNLAEALERSLAELRGQPPAKDGSAGRSRATARSRPGKKKGARRRKVA